MAKALTKKQKGFVKDYVESGNGTQAVLKNYDVANARTAAVIASENLIKPDIIEAIGNIADHIPDSMLIKVHLEGLEATSSRFTPEGDLITVPDYATRHKFVDSGYKLKGSYAAEKTHSLNVNLEGKIESSDAEAIRKRYEAELKAKLLE